MRRRGLCGHLKKDARIVARRVEIEMRDQPFGEPLHIAMDQQQCARPNREYEDPFQALEKRDRPKSKRRINVRPSRGGLRHILWEPGQLVRHLRPYLYYSFDLQRLSRSLDSWHSSTSRLAEVIVTSLQAPSVPLLRTEAVRRRLQVDPRIMRCAGWTLVLWVVLFWRLGYPSFWDPDEAHYAQTSREMLAAHNWMVPTYDGQPFFDKPVLFHWLQMLSFSVLGATEFAARLVPAIAALGLVGCTAWLGAELFTVNTGELAALMLVLLPATFALSAYAILDMLFTMFIFAGAALLTVAALKERPRLQYPAYGCIALAVLTKGPVALALLGLALAFSLLLAPAARRKLLSLHLCEGLAVVGACSLPWFVWMWIRFDGAFVEGYVLKENVWLFAKSLYVHQYSPFVYLRVLLVGLLPWTPIVLGRLVDAACGRRLDTAERLLLAWAIAVTGFFMVSRYRLDHYLYPAAPALCLLAAAAWERARNMPLSQRRGVWIGSLGATAVVAGAGVLFVLWFERVPVDLPREMQVAAVGLAGGGLLALVQTVSPRSVLPRIPVPL